MNDTKVISKRNECGCYDNHCNCKNTFEEVVNGDKNIRGARSSYMYSFGYHLDDDFGYWDIGESGDENFISEIQIDQDKDLAIKVLNLNGIELKKYDCLDDASTYTKCILHLITLFDLKKNILKYSKGNLGKLSRQIIYEITDVLEEERQREIAYDPNFGDKKLCICGHPYYRHFDTYDDMEPIGCKYCECMEFKEA
jgi:hypothetical protein